MPSSRCCALTAQPLPRGPTRTRQRSSGPLPAPRARICFLTTCGPARLSGVTTGSTTSSRSRCHRCRLPWPIAAVYCGSRRRLPEVRCPAPRPRPHRRPIASDDSSCSARGWERPRQRCPEGVARGSHAPDGATRCRPAEITSYRIIELARLKHDSPGGRLTVILGSGATTESAWGQAHTWVGRVLRPP